MKLDELYSGDPRSAETVDRFRVASSVPFKTLQKLPEVLEHAGPRTDVFDASNVGRVSSAPGRSKLNALQSVFRNEKDVIACAFTGTEWFCVGINVEK